MSKFINLFIVYKLQVIPALSTFCIYATIGVFALYILQTTYFVACLTLDQRRVDAKRNACILCYTHKEDYKPNRCYRFGVQDFFFKKICGPLITKLPIKVCLNMVFIIRWYILLLYFYQTVRFVISHRKRCINTLHLCSQCNRVDMFLGCMRILGSLKRFGASFMQIFIRKTRLGCR